MPNVVNSDLSTVFDRINSAVETINRRISAVEDTLTASGANVRAAVRREGDIIVWARVGGSWAVGYVDHRASEDDIRRLLDCSREIRARCLPLLPRLVTAVHEAGRELLRVVEEVVEG